MSVSDFVHRLFHPSEEALRSMYRLGRTAGYEAGRRDSGDLPALTPCSVQNTEPLIMLPVCPKHGCNLKLAEKPEQGGYWSYCPECRQLPAQSDSKPLKAVVYRPGERWKAYNLERIAECETLVLPQVRKGEEESCHN